MTAMPTKSDVSRRHFLRSAGAVVLGGATQRTHAAKTAADDLPATGIELGELASFDDLMRDFVRGQKVVGAALAVSKNSRLVYARGFGLQNREARQPVEPASLFRIASVSKPFTAAAIMQLVQHKSLDLDAKVCTVLGLNETQDPRWQQITISHLLHHTGGWDRDKSFDPMFRSVKIARHFKIPPPAMPADIIRYMTAQPLDFDPGGAYAYSNFGYSLLGRVIEHVTRMKYGDYVRRQVLAPLGIGQMQLGATPAAGRRPNEVRYYDLKGRTGPSVIGKIGQQVPLPYGTWCLEAMDAHGGWIASAVELVRFASAFDVPERCRILQRPGIMTMFARPQGPAGYKPGGQAKPVYYACGWSVREAGRGGHNTWHNGALDGTSTLLVRRHDGLNWAVLFNCREGADGRALADSIDPLVHKAADAVTNWPDVDYFAK